MKRETKSENKSSLKERNIAANEKEVIDNSGKNYSTNPKTSPAPKKSKDDSIDENDYSNIGYGSNVFIGADVKDDKAATSRTRYKMDDYGSTGKRNNKNSK